MLYDAFPAIEVKWRFTGVEQRRTSCELCGHDIAHVYYARSNTGAVIGVGCDCINTLLDPDERGKVELFTRRMNRAAAQWSKKLPAPKDGETRDQYIVRRVTEMGNARAASNAYAAIGHQGFTDARLTARNEHKAELDDLRSKITSNYSAESNAYMQRISEIENAAIDKLHAQVEAKYKANRFDFNRQAWEVRKI